MRGSRRALLAVLASLVLAVPAAGAARKVARFDWFEYRGDDRLPAPGAGQYGNPVLQGFYPDPSVVRVGGDYYLVNSTFAWFPGIPVWHSRDLVNWTQIGNAIDRPTQLNFDKMTMQQGVYAPDISWHAGKFYILNTCVGCGGNFVITANQPARVRGPTRSGCRRSTGSTRRCSSIRTGPPGSFTTDRLKASRDTKGIRRSGCTSSTPAR